MFSLIEANKDKLKTKEGRIILGMAAMQFMPLMQKEEQIKAKAIQQQLTNEIQMMKLQQGESKLELQAERLDAYRDKLASGKTVKDETQKEYDAIATRADRLAQHLAQTPGDKILKQRYDDTIAQLNTFKERITPTAPSKKYGDWLTSTIAKPDADLQIAGSIPPDVKSKLSPEDLAALIDRLKKNPLEGYARIDWLRNRLRGGETTIGKTNEYYR
jgi:ribosome assembly protein YihI (activator of Der GTPase)